ncbi:SDR family NAD(P)-dependent oxidoreductase [Gilvimarinus algae]|uniref:SDR family oxidoreductase n=1 Tax=Gilvimarinus algae TaxID=3058037 RepID=A0ABT8TJ66_9GAMM|nr:SDR family oxidoreductase [Gilvimarinus sp. SDUM040014]MDO3383976.1 SDR family oxidoreductase [Gilvimarinus sp. SDUM040014]
MTNKIALITGASRGLGRNMVLHLTRMGVDTVFTYHTDAQAAQTLCAEVEAMGGKTHALALDASDIVSFEPFVKALRQALEVNWRRDSFDYLVNNAGIGINALFEQTTEEQFDRLMNIHVKGVFFLTQVLLPVIADSGRIVNISSGLTRFCYPGYAAYGAMKGAVEVLTRYLAKELGPRGIRVNTLAPGAIETDFGGGHVRDNAELNRFIASQTALGRAGQPDDIGGAIAALLADDSGWINAQRLEVSGGMML